jgi:hypothetical protein
MLMFTIDYLFRDCYIKLSTISSNLTLNNLKNSPVLSGIINPYVI